MNQRNIGKLHTNTQNKLSSMHSKGVNEIKNWQAHAFNQTENLIKLFATLYQYIYKEMSKKRGERRKF